MIRTPLNFIYNEKAYKNGLNFATDVFQAKGKTWHTDSSILYFGPVFLPSGFFNPLIDGILRKKSEKKADKSSDFTHDTSQFTGEGFVID